MKKYLIALLIALVLLSAASASAETFYSRQVTNCNEYVTLRAKPDASSAELLQVQVGEVVMAAPYNGEFSYCCYDDTFGYIKSQYLSSNIYPYSEGVFKVGNCNEWVSMRSMPLRGADVIMRVPLGAQFDAVIYHDGPYEPSSFAYVQYNGRCGFVLWDYVVPVEHEGWQ